MTDEECLKEIKTKFCRKDGKLNSALLRRDYFKNGLLNKFILERTSFLSLAASYTERLHCIEKGFKTVQLCPFSNEPLLFSPNKKCYTKCKIEFIQKIQNIPERVEKQKVSHQETIKRKKQSLINSFIENNYNKLSLSDVKLQIKSLKRRFKSTQIFYLNDYIDKKDLLCSIIFYTNSPLLPLNIKSGFAWAERIYLIINNIYKPNVCADNPNKKAKFINSYKGYQQASNNIERVKHHFLNNVKPSINQQNFDIINEHQINNLRDQRINLKCRNCNTEFDADLRSGRWKNIYCFGCYKPTNRSKTEDDIVDFLKQNGVKNIILNYNGVIKNRELDIYLPDYNLAIEVDGLLWHSFGSCYPNNIDWELKYKYKLARKSIECFRKGIHLMHVYDNEWRDKKDIVKSLILAKLNRCEKKLFARKCSIEDLTKEQQIQFFKKNSLYDYKESFKSFGLFYNNTLVSLLSFNVQDNKVILTDYITTLNTTVIGGFSKLLNHVKKLHLNFCIEAQGDFRFFTQKLLQKTGFDLIKLCKPTLFSTDGHFLFLKNKNSSKKQRNFYDCGHGIFQLKH